MTKIHRNKLIIERETKKNTLSSPIKSIHCLLAIVPYLYHVSLGQVIIVIVLDWIRNVILMMSFISRRTITLPDLITTCPFPMACNAAYESASAKADAWLVSFGIPYEESQEKYNLWSALSFPRSSSARLQEACEVWTLLFLADDIMDSLIVSGSIDHSKRSLFQNMTECLQAAGSFKPLTPFAAALHDWWQRISVHATRSCQQRLIETYQQANAASLQQMSDRNNRQTIPDLETYIYERRDTSYGRVVCSFVEYSLDLNIPDQCWTNEIFKLLIDYATDTAAWTNVSIALRNKRFYRSHRSHGYR